MPLSPSILTEADFVERVRSLAAQATVCRVAVGYCGEGGYAFFPEAPGDWPHDFRVLVDASDNAVRMGFTNPEGLERLLGMGAVVKSIEGLHSKVYTFDNDSALVGSVNLSKHAITTQRQLALETTSDSTVKGINSWFDRLWRTTKGRLDADAVARLKKLWPRARGKNGAPKGKVRRAGPRWKGRAPEAPLPDISFDIGISKATLREVMRRFQTSPCKYPGHEGQTCAEAARSIERWYLTESVEFHRLYKRRRQWSRDDLGELHKLAFLNGKNAQVGRPRFLRQNPKQVAEKVEYLLEGEGDPYIRLERVLDGKSKASVPGFGLAAWACLMHLWNPKAFAIFNEPVMNALKGLKVEAGSTASHRRAAKYRNLSEAMNHLTKQLGLGNLSRADHFFDGLGKGHFRIPRKSS